MTTLTEKTLRDALNTIHEPGSGKPLMASGIVTSLSVREGRVGLVLTIRPHERERGEMLVRLCEETLQTVPGVQSVSAVLTAQRTEEGKRPGAVWNLTPLPHVRQVVAVASGKGGVGKSTSAVGLALALVEAGMRVGLLDADIYGPSLPRMLGVSGRPELDAQRQMLPLSAHGVRFFSIGLLTDEAAILRGPMIAKTLHQMLRGVAWAHAKDPLDVLLIDMPPGTGDTHLSLAQQAPLSGAIIITTPQEVAVMDARKCANMFSKVNIPLLGVIENMSWFEDISRQRQALFGAGGGAKLAQETGTALLAQIPLVPDIGAALDAGLTTEQTRSLAALYAPAVTVFSAVKEKKFSTQ